MEEDHVLTIPLGLTLRDAEVHRSGQSDEDTVTALYEQLRPALLVYVYHLIGSTRDAEDLVQIAFLQLFDRLGGNSEIKNVRGWIYRTVHNLAVDYASRGARRDSLLKEWFADAGELNVQTAEEELISRQQIEQALSVLNERERHCLMLRAEGLSYQEIGDLLEISQKSVSVYLARGLKKFGSQHENENLK